MTTPPQPQPGGPIRFSTDVFPERERASAWLDTFGRGIAKFDLAPMPGVSFYAHMDMRLMPGLTLVSGSGAVKDVGRTRALAADGNDSVVLQIASCTGLASQFGQEILVGAGDAVLLSNSAVGNFTFEREQSVLVIGLPRTTLAPFLADPDAVFPRAVPNDNEALRLLKSYVSAVDDASVPPSENLQRLVVDHVHDLVALALGATRDAAERARTRGLSAARLHAAKAYAMKHLDQASLSAASIGAHLGVTARYIHMLFEPTGMSVSEFVLAERLAHAHRMLTSPRHRGEAISTIAFEVGFTDLSHFNRAFRRRYGCTPSDVRMAARREQT